MGEHPDRIRREIVATRNENKARRAAGVAQGNALEPTDISCASSPCIRIGKTVVRPIDHVRGEINGEFRSTREIAERLGMAVQVVGPPLGMLRRHGEVELIHGSSGECLWRESPGGGLHGARSTERAGAVGDHR